MMKKRIYFFDWRGTLDQLPEIDVEELIYRLKAKGHIVVLYCACPSDVPQDIARIFDHVQSITSINEVVSGMLAGVEELGFFRLGDYEGVDEVVFINDETWLKESVEDNDAVRRFGVRWTFVNAKDIKTILPGGQ